MAELGQQARATAGGVLAATCISTLVVNANTSAVSILLPAISEDTGMSVNTLQWAVTGYSLVGAAVIITSGSLGDVFGRKRIFQLGLLLFVVSCVLIALAQSGGMVIAGRLIQGASGATILACGLSLLTVATSGENQLRSVSLWGAAAAVGAAAGPLLGGLLVDITGWQGLFWIDAGVAVGCMVLTYVTVSESRDPDRPPTIDYAGTVLVALTLVPLILGVSKSGDWGWISVETLGCFALSIVAGYAFVKVEQRVKIPLLDLQLLRNRILVGATLAILIGAGTINGLMYLLSLYFQNPAALGFSPLEAGLATLPATVGLVVVAPLVPRLAKKLGGRQTIGAGFLISTVGFAAIGFTHVVVAVRRVPAPHHRHRGRHGAVERSVLLSSNVLCRREAGRRGLGGLQHGSVRRRSRGHGAGGDRLRHRDRQPGTGRQVRFGRTGGRALCGGLGDDRDQRARHSPGGRRDPATPCRRGHPAGRRRRRCLPPAHPAHHRERGVGFRHHPHESGRNAMTATDHPTAVPFTTDDYAGRMARVVADAGAAGLDGVLVTPGPDLVWLTGYQPTAITERLTMLFLTADREPTLLVPTLERPDAEAAEGTPATTLVAWTDGADPYAAASPMLRPEGTYGDLRQRMVDAPARTAGCAPRLELRLDDAADADAAGGQGPQRAGPDDRCGRRGRRGVRGDRQGAFRRQARDRRGRRPRRAAQAASATNRSTSPWSARDPTAPTRTTRRVTG